MNKIQGNIILIGHKSCGKSTLGYNFAKAHADYMFIDTDDLIKLTFYGSQEDLAAKSSAKSIAEIYQQLGEQRFRKLESCLIADLANASWSSKIIIATGGGCVLNPENIINLKKLGKLIYLYCNPEVIYHRWLENNTTPSFINNDYAYNDYITQRSLLYQQAADCTFDVSSITNSEVCDFG